MQPPSSFISCSPAGCRPPESCSACVCISIFILPQQRALLFFGCLEQECKAVAQWHHLAASSGCTGGGGWFLAFLGSAADRSHPWVLPSSFTFLLTSKHIPLVGSFPPPAALQPFCFLFQMWFITLVGFFWELVVVATSVWHPARCAQRKGFAVSWRWPYARERADSSVRPARAESPGFLRDRGGCRDAESHNDPHFLPSPGVGYTHISGDEVLKSEYHTLFTFFSSFTKNILPSFSFLL